MDSPNEEDHQSHIRQFFDPLFHKLKPYIALLLALVLGWIGYRAFTNNLIIFKPLYVIARDATWYPASIPGKEQSMLAFSNELFFDVASAEDFKVKLIGVGYSGLLRGLQTGEFDAVATSLLPTSANKEHYYFSDPFYRLGPVLVVKSDSKVRSLEDLGSGTVAVRRGFKIPFNPEEYPNLIITVYDQPRDVVPKLIDNTIDAIIMDAIQGYNTTQGYYSGRMKVATDPLNDEGLRLVALKNANGVELIDRFNKGLSEIKENGAYDQILQKWDLIDTEKPKVDLLQKASLLIDAAGVHQAILVADAL